MAKEEIKKLTQMQKNYLVKRIDEIANTKIVKLGGKANYGVPASRQYYSSPCMGRIAKHGIDISVLRAITDGTVKLQSKADVMTSFKEIIANSGKSYFSLDSLTFIDLKGLEEYNADRNKKMDADHKASQKRISSVRSEADRLKDSVVLEGSLAIEMLDKFEKKEF